MMIQEALEQEIQAWKTLAQQTPPQPGLMYVALDKEIVLKLGQPWTVDIRARHGGSRAKLCFQNAIRRAMSDDLLYVEGFAVTPSLGIPMHHAWVGTPTGLAIDPTWRNLSHDRSEYWGIAFDAEEAFRLMAEHGAYGLLDISDPWCREFIEGCWPGTIPNRFLGGRPFNGGKNGQGSRPMVGGTSRQPERVAGRR